MQTRADGASVCVLSKGGGDYSVLRMSRVFPVARKFTGEARKQDSNRSVSQKAPSLKARKRGTGGHWCHRDLRPPNIFPSPQTEDRPYRVL